MLLMGRIELPFIDFALQLICRSAASTLRTIYKISIERPIVKPRPKSQGFHYYGIISPKTILNKQTIFSTQESFKDNLTFWK